MVTVLMDEGREVCHRSMLPNNDERWVSRGAHEHLAFFVYMSVVVVMVVINDCETLAVGIIETCPLCEDVIWLVIIKRSIASSPFCYMSPIVQICMFVLGRQHIRYASLANHPEGHGA